MVHSKNCCYKGCHNDSRFLDSTVVKGAVFFPFPKPKTRLEKCIRWIKACGRVDYTPDKIKKHHYVCNEHFVGGVGPTEANPDPITYQFKTTLSAQTTKKAQKDTTISYNNGNHQSKSLEVAELIKSAEQLTECLSDIPTLDYDDFKTFSNLKTTVEQVVSNEFNTMDFDVPTNLVKCENNEIVHCKVEIPVHESDTTFAISDTSVPRIKPTFLSLNDIFFKFYDFQLKNPDSQLMWCMVKNHDYPSLIIRKTKSSGDFDFFTVEINNIYEVKVKADGALIGEEHSIWGSGMFLKTVNDFQQLLSFLSFLDKCTLCRGIECTEVAELPNLNGATRNPNTNSLHSTDCDYVCVAKPNTVSKCSNCSRLKIISGNRLKRRKLSHKTQNMIEIQKIPLYPLRWHIVQQ